MVTRTLETHDDGHLDIELGGGGDNALGDDVTTHDATEDVDEDGVHFGVGSDETESLSDLRSCGTTAHVQEVGWRATMKFDDVHCGHGQTRTVH